MNSASCPAQSLDSLPYDAKTPVNRFIQVTPALARIFLARSVLNRTIRLPQVKSLAKAMRAGEWHFNGDSIRFNTEGKLFDGQHRLHGIILSGVTLTLQVWFGLEPRSMTTEGIGRTKTLPHFLTMGGHKNANNLAATIRIFHHYLEGTSPAAVNSTSEPVAYWQAEQHLTTHPGLEKSHSHQEKNRSAYPNIGVAATYHYLMSKVDKAMADTFFERLSDGSDLKIDNPILILREALNSRNKKEKNMAEWWAVYLRRTWKAYRAYLRTGQVARNLLTPPTQEELKDFSIDGLPADWATK